MTKSTTIIGVPGWACLNKEGNRTSQENLLVGFLNDLCFRSGLQALLPATIFASPRIVEPKAKINTLNPSYFGYCFVIIETKKAKTTS